MNTPLPATRYADGVYDKNAPGLAGYAAVSSSGYSSNEERLVSIALQAQSAPADQLRVTTQPRNLFPPRFGYPTTELTIRDVVNVDRRYPDSSAQFSGTNGGMAGSSSPSLGWW